MSDATPIEGKCNAHLRGDEAGNLCPKDPEPGRTRCRDHGGLSPRAAEHPRFKHGGFSQGGAGLEIFTEPFSPSEIQLIERWRREPEEAVRLQLAEGAVVQRRALRAGNVDAYARVGTMIATTARALVSLREIPAAEKGLPRIVEVFEGKTPEDFTHDLELLQRDAAVPA